MMMQQEYIHLMQQVKGLFETYYKNMFEMFKAKPRLRIVYIDLKTKDIINLDFRKLVYIDGVYWRINKVVDYQPNKNQPTKVELVEWLTDRCICSNTSTIF